MMISFCDRKWTIYERSIRQNTSRTSSPPSSSPFIVVGKTSSTEEKTTTIKARIFLHSSSLPWLFRPLQRVQSFRRVSLWARRLIILTWGVWSGTNFLQSQKQPFESELAKEREMMKHSGKTRRRRRLRMIRTEQEKMSDHRTKMKMMITSVFIPFPFSKDGQTGKEKKRRNLDECIIVSNQPVEFLEWLIHPSIAAPEEEIWIWFRAKQKKNMKHVVAAFAQALSQAFPPPSKTSENSAMGQEIPVLFSKLCCCFVAPLTRKKEAPNKKSVKSWGVIELCGLFSKLFCSSSCETQS